MDKIKYTATVLKNEELQPEIFSLLLKVGEIAEYAVPGQFIDLYSKEKSRMLPRPISICDVDKAAKTMRIVFRIAGEGTREFSKLKEGETVEVVGPLGKGYDLPNASAEVNGEAAMAGADATGNHILLGGGIGIPPMLYLAKSLSEAGVPKSNIKTVNLNISHYTLLTIIQFRFISNKLFIRKLPHDTFISHHTIVFFSACN